MAVLASLCLVEAGCARQTQVIKSKSSAKIPLSASVVPSQILGFAVSQEDLSTTLKGAQRPHYVDATALFSVRQSDQELLATLQVSRFRDGDEFQTKSFRRALVGQIGATAPRQLRVGDVSVTFTTAKGLTIAIWFRSKQMFVLAIRDTFKNTKTLVRAAVNIKP